MFEVFLKTGEGFVLFHQLILQLLAFLFSFLCYSFELVFHLNMSSNFHFVFVQDFFNGFAFGFLLT